MVEQAGVKKQYICPWCKNTFEQIVNYSAGNNVSGTYPPQPGKRAALSDQVKCVKCGNFISTWEKIDLGEGKSIKVRR